MTNATKTTTQLTILLVPKQKHEQTLRDSKYLSAKDPQRAVFSFSKLTKLMKKIQPFITSSLLLKP